MSIHARIARMTNQNSLKISISLILSLIPTISLLAGVADQKAINRNESFVRAAVDKSAAQNETKNDLAILESKLQKNPSNTQLLYKKASVYADQGDWKKTLETLDQIALLQPNHAEANKLRQIVEAKKRAEPHNEFGFNENIAYVSDLAAFWDYSSLFYYRLTDHGKFGGHINYAHRYSTSGKQFLFEAYPKFSKNVFATFTFGYANTTQILYPTYQYQVEVFVDVANGFEFSLGQTGKRFVRFNNQRIFDYTGSIGKYFGSSFVWFRPHHYTPKNTEFYEVGFRKDFATAGNFISLVVSAGKLPDIGDIPPLDKMVVIHQKGIGVNAQTALSKSVFLNYGVGYTVQRFPTGLRRELTDGTIGIHWKI